MLAPASPKVGTAGSGRDWLHPALRLINTLNGPGFVVLAEAGRQAGAGGAVVLVTAFAALAAFASRRACAIAREAETHKIEGGGGDLAGPCRTLYGERGAQVAAAACATALLACAVAQIILCVQLADALEEALTGKRCGFVVRAPSLEHGGAFFYAGCRPASEPLPTPALEASLGVVVTLCLARLARRMESTGSAKPQIVGFICFCLGAWRWASYLHRETISARAVAWLGPDPLKAAPAVCFNFACVLAVPPLALRGRSDPAARGASAGIGFMALVYVVMALLGARGAPTAPSADALLATGHPGDVLAVLFLFVSQLAAIPTYLAGADGLVKAHLAPRAAASLASITAWGLAVAAHESELFAALVDWTSLLLLGFTNFSLPLVLDVAWGHPMPGTGSIALRRLSRALASLTVAGFATLVFREAGAPWYVLAAIAGAAVGSPLPSGRVRRDSGETEV